METTWKCPHFPCKKLGETCSFLAVLRYPGVLEYQRVPLGNLQYPWVIWSTLWGFIRVLYKTLGYFRSKRYSKVPTWLQISRDLCEAFENGIYSRLFFNGWILQFRRGEGLKERNNHNFVKKVSFNLFLSTNLAKYDKGVWQCSLCES